MCLCMFPGVAVAIIGWHHRFRLDVAMPHLAQSSLAYLVFHARGGGAHGTPSASSGICYFGARYVAMLRLACQGGAESIEALNSFTKPVLQWYSGYLPLFASDWGIAH